MNPTALIRSAQRRTKLRDFGEPDIRGPLDRLTHSLESEAGLNFTGRVAAHQDLMQLLVNRLRLQADRTRYPDIGTERIERPIFITGLPRSGSTLLHQLLARDPAHRAPLTWQVRRPSPPPALARWTRKVHILKTAFELYWFNRSVPQFKKIHPVGACLPQECIEILSHTFASYRFHTLYYVPSYQTWLDTEDLTPAYAWHKRFLQHLQWRTPRKRWVLKAPAHVFSLDALLRVYPDAMIVQTHRDPRVAMGSALDMTVVLHRLFSDHVDRKRLAREVTRHWAIMLDRAMRVRTASPATFVDIDYSELIEAPLETVARIYRRLGLNLTPQAKAAMRVWLDRHPQNRHGVHHYSLAGFGIDVDEFDELFRPYQNAFDRSESFPKQDRTSKFNREPTLP